MYVKKLEGTKAPHIQHVSKNKRFLIKISTFLGPLHRELRSEIHQFYKYT